MSSAIFFALIGTLGWGLSNAAAKKLVENFGPVRAVVFRNVVTVFILLGVLAVVGFPTGFSLWSLGFGIALSVLGYFPFYFFLKGIERGKVGVIYAVSEGWVIIASVIGFAFLGDVFSMQKLWALGAVVIGVIIASVDVRDIAKSGLASLERGIGYALAAALFWGVVFAFFKYPSAALGGVFFALIVEGFVFFSALAHLAFTRKPLLQGNLEVGTLKKLWPYALLAGIGAGLGTSFINLGYATGEIALVSAVAGAQVLVAAFFARFFYSEHLTLKQYVGIAAVFTGIALAALL